MDLATEILELRLARESAPVYHGNGDFETAIERCDFAAAARIAAEAVASWDPAPGQEHQLLLRHTWFDKWLVAMAAARRPDPYGTRGAVLYWLDTCDTRVVGTWGNMEASA